MYIGGLDVGTTGCKIAVYDGQGALCDTYYQEYQVTRTGGQHEIDFTVVRDGVLKLLQAAVRKFELSALGVTSFGETFVMLDELDQVLAPSMLYTDPRGAEECAALGDQIGATRYTALTGVQPNSMYSIGKIMWLKKHMPTQYARCKRILLGEDYIVYTLSGVAQIDYSLAARTAAFDIERKQWIGEIFDAAGVDPELMSKPVPAGTIAGTLRPELKTQLGIDYDITIVNGCHDQVAAMIGSGVFESDIAMDGTGTVECIPVVFNEKPEDMALYEGGYSVVPYIDNKYACYAFSFTGGATLKWFRDCFAEKEKADFENAYAVLDQNVPKQPTGLLVLPHFAGAATPYMDPDSKAAILGLTLEHTKYDLYKALMEGTSYEMLLNFNALRRFTGEIRELRATGGGARSDVWLQIKADILGMSITAVSSKETGAAGTAALAGVAVGAYRNLKDIIGVMAQVRQVFTPNPEHKAVYDSLYAKYKGIYAAIRTL